MPHSLHQPFGNELVEHRDNREQVNRVVPGHPLMNCARALAKTLAGEPTPVSYPAMPVLVKTPAHPVVVSPPPLSEIGQWEVEVREDGVRALFYNTAHALRGMALTGSAVTEKTVWIKELPAVLTASGE